MPCSTNKRVLVFSPYGDWLVHEQANAVITSALRVRGAEVLVVRCDGVYRESCYILVASSDPTAQCLQCQQKGERLFSTFGLPIEQISSSLTAEDWSIAQAWADALPPEQYRYATFNGLPLGEWITPTVCSYHQIGPSRLHLPRIREHHKKYLIYCLVTYFAAERIFDRFQPTNVLMFAGGGMAHSAVFHLARARGIDVLSHDRGRNKGSFTFTANDEVSAFHTRFSLNREWKDIALPQKTLEEVATYVQQRREGVNHNSWSFYQNSTDPKEVRKILNIPPDAKIVSAFTSSEYEKIYYKEYRDIPSQIDILRNLIEVFRGRSEYLVIRHHPNIGGGHNTTFPDEEFLTGAYELFNNAPPNVRIIMPFEELTSYALLWNSVAAIAFFSTIGLEAVTTGIPTAICEASLYSPGATHTIKDFSKQALGHLVEELLQSSTRFTIEHLRKVYRYLNVFVFKHSTLFQSFRIGENSQPDILIQSLEELREENDPGLDRICDYFLKGTSVYELPTAEDKARNSLDEEVFFQEELARLQNTRSALSHTRVEPRASETSTLAIIRMCQKESHSEATDFATWLRMQRYQSFTTHELHYSPTESHQKRLESLKNLVENLTAELILVTNDAFFYDECFLSSSAEFLRINNQIKGVRWASWLSTAGVGISGSLFTQTSTDPALVEQKLETDLWPESLLSFTVIRKVGLLQILVEGIFESSPQAAGGKFLSFLESPEILAVKKPGMKYRPISREATQLNTASLTGNMSVTTAQNDNTEIFSPAITAFYEQDPKPPKYFYEGTRGPLVSVIAVHSSAGTTKAYTPWSESFRKSRYQNTEKHEILWSPQMTPETLVSQLRHCQDKMKGEFVYLGLDHVSISDAFLASAMDFLCQSTSGPFDGINFAAYLSGESGAQLQTARFPAELKQHDLASAKRSLGSVWHPLLPFSFVVIRASVYHAILESLSQEHLATNDQLSDQIYNRLYGENSGVSFYHSSFPYLSFIAAPPFNETAQECINLVNANKAGEALPLLETLKAYYPQEGGVDFLRGVCKAKLGNIWEARRDLESELSHNPNHQPSQQLIGEISAILPTKDLGFQHVVGAIDSVFGHLVSGQEQFLFEMAKSLPDGAVIAEIGTFYGRSTVSMAFACVGTRKHIYCLDTFCWNGGVVGGSEDWQDLWEHNMQRLGLREWVTPLRGRSRHLLAHWGNKPKIDFAFIDGSHNYQDVLDDFRLIFPLIKPGGWIALHDVCDDWPGPMQVWKENAMPFLLNHRFCHTIACGQKPAAQASSVVGKHPNVEIHAS